MKVSEIQNTEIRRQELQATLDGGKTQLERNKLGQFSTPIDLAKEILKYGVSLVGDKKIRFLDPAIGTGAFYSALLQTKHDNNIDKAVGYDIDEFYAQPSIDLWKDFELQINIQDFTRQQPTPEFNLLICNPPYVRHHHISNEDKARLQQLSGNIANQKLSGLAGLYCYFLLLSHKWMEDEGVAGWLIPSEFMDVNYGEAIKKYLLEDVTLLHVHRFDPNDVQFTDALVSSAVVWIKKVRPPKGHSVRFTFGGSLLNPHISKNVSIKDLLEERKWTRFPKAEKRIANGHVKLGDIFKIKRGIATGSNDFFIMSEEDLIKWDLPMSVFRPILPSPRYVTQNVIDSDDQGNPITDRRLFLLDLSIEEEKVKDLYPSVWRYLQVGKQKGLHERYLCTNRPMWYLQEKRPPAPIICTYMARSLKEDQHPFRFILNKSKATITNGYLAMYPQPKFADFLSKNPNALFEVWEALNHISIEHILHEGRVYGGGLHKLEPKELANVSLPAFDKIYSQVAQPKQMKLSLESAIAPE